MHPLGGHVALRNLNLSPFAVQEYCPYGTQPLWRYRGLPLFTLCVNISGKKFKFGKNFILPPVTFKDNVLFK